MVMTISIHIVPYCHQISIPKHAIRQQACHWWSGKSVDGSDAEPDNPAITAFWKIPSKVQVLDWPIQCRQQREWAPSGEKGATAEAGTLRLGEWNFHSPSGRARESLRTSLSWYSVITRSGIAYIQPWEYYCKFDSPIRVEIRKMKVRALILARLERRHNEVERVWPYQKGYI